MLTLAIFLYTSLNCAIHAKRDGIRWGDTAISLHTHGWGGILDYSKLKVPSSDQIFIGVSGRGVGWGCILDYSKIKVPSSGQIFKWGGGGKRPHSSNT